MRRASELPVAGPASTDVLAAGGGLEMPGRTRTTTPLPTRESYPDRQELIPGAREPDTLTHREPGAIGGQFTGMDIPPTPTNLMDEDTIADRLREGGDPDPAAHLREKR